MSSLPDTNIIKGACACGAINITFPKSAYPSFSALCHCLSCRATSGSLFSVILPMASKDITVSKGKPKVYADSDTGSGNVCERHFCGDCGTPIMSIVREAPETAYVKGGLFAKQGVELPKPGVELWWKRSEKWEEPAKGVKLSE